MTDAERLANLQSYADMKREVHTNPVEIEQADLDWLLSLGWRYLVERDDEEMEI